MKVFKIFRKNVRILLSYCFIPCTILLFFNGCERNPFFSEPEKELVELLVNGEPPVIVRKPNIYIYPESDLYLSVRIELPLGGEITQSDPEYRDGWEVFVDTEGIIDHQYSCLFYECDVPDVFQRTEGWIVKQKDLTEFFQGNMEEYGFIEGEIQDFLEYWIPVLDANSYYEIFPQRKEILNQVVRLEFSHQPESILRLFYLINGTDNPAYELTTLETTGFTRQGFTVVEWGGILL
ncbi:hypothetical protein ACFL4K_01140 [Candidatus Neomarinimicrobiota bacterium]